RTRSGAARPDIENAPGVHPGDAAAPCPDAVNVDLRRPDRIAFDEMIGADRNIEIIDQTDVSAGTPHVVSDEISVSQELAEMKCCGNPPGRPRKHRLHRKSRRAPGGDDAAA